MATNTTLQTRNVTKFNSLPSHESFLNDDERAILTAILSLLVTIGLLANGTVVYAICSSVTSYIDVPTNIFILSQVFADLATASTATLHMFHMFTWNWELFYICMTFAWFSSLGSLLLLTLNRVISVFDPLKYAVRMTPFRAKMFVLVIWTIALVISLLHLAGYLMHSNTNVFNYGRYYAVFLIMGVILSNVYMYGQSRKQMKKIKKQNTLMTGIQRSLREDFKSVKTLGLVGGTFLLSCFPITVIVFVYGSEKESARFQRHAAFCVPLMALNPVLDPFIYYFRSKEFRLFYQRFSRLHGWR